MEWIPVQKRLATNLAKCIKEHQTNYYALEVASGVSRQTISRYAKAQDKSPDLRVIRKLASALGVSVGTLLN